MTIPVTLIFLPNEQMLAGRVELIIGPMFAGKTTEMLRRIDRAELGRHRCIVMKYQKDSNFEHGSVNTHDEWSHEAIECNALMPHIQECLGYHTIGIDEGHFFDDLCQFCQQLANAGKRVIVAALDGSYLREPFENVLSLISNCESVVKLTAVCTETGKEAAFTQRIINATGTHLVGGTETYSAVSRQTYFHLNHAGEIFLTIGPVQSGKSTELIRQMARHAIAGRRTLLLRPIGSTKEVTEAIEVRNVDQLPFPETLNNYDVIGVDDAHEFMNISEWADILANNGKIVMLSGLDSDAHQRVFPEMMNLIPKCENVKKLDSICPLTGLPAPFSLHLGQNLIPISRLGLMSQLSLLQMLRF